MKPEEEIGEEIEDLMKEPFKVLVEKHWPVAVWIIAVAEVAEVLWLVFA